VFTNIAAALGEASVPIWHDGILAYGTVQLEGI
jgi:hypothetical protein